VSQGGDAPGAACSTARPRGHKVPAARQHIDRGAQTGPCSQARCRTVKSLRASWGGVGPAGGLHFRGEAGSSIFGGFRGVAGGDWPRPGALRGWVPSLHEDADPPCRPRMSTLLDGDVPLQDRSPAPLSRSSLARRDAHALTDVGIGHGKTWRRPPVTPPSGSSRPPYTEQMPPLGGFFGVEIVRHSPPRGRAGWSRTIFVGAPASASQGPRSGNPVHLQSARDREC